MFHNNKKLRTLYLRNLYYLLTFILLHCPMFVFFILSIFNDKEPTGERPGLKWFSYFAFLITCSIPTFTSISRIVSGLVRIKFIHKFFKRRRVERERKKLQAIGESLKEPLSISLTKEDDFEWLEKYAMRNFMRDILLSICYCIWMSENDPKKDETITDTAVMFENNYCFTEKDFKKTSCKESFKINVIEYSPKFFYCLRDLEEIPSEEMIKSFLPENNKQGITESQGKSGSFFISTDDNRYFIKTLKYEELELIRGTFLSDYYRHLKNNVNSLICPIYGIFKLHTEGDDDIIFLIMRNLIGDFKDDVVCKFDLKGSTFKRKEDINEKPVDKSVMKDLNFDEIEKALLLSKDNIKKIREVTRKDSEFLKSLGLMDYSLFVVKLTLDKDQSKSIFGEKIQQKQERDYQKLMNDDDDNRISTLSCQTTYVGDSHYKRFLYPSIREGSAYIIAIIDYLQFYNFFKLMETNYRLFLQLRGKNIEKVSCVNPTLYSERFIKFVEKITEVKELLSSGDSRKTSNISENEQPAFSNENKKKSITSGVRVMLKPSPK